LTIDHPISLLPPSPFPWGRERIKVGEEGGLLTVDF